MEVSLTRSDLKRGSRTEIFPGCCLPLKMEKKVLALKYRPQEFKDLIGQDLITETITKAIEINKTPNAYLLTGIRGVGKTTTARLIAKKLNCLSYTTKSTNCNAEKFCSSCEEIINSRHIDVLEMDAASKTGIDDIRDLIENSKYSPTSAKFKIFIIDEVHMLSKQAFNGLLKTLEEPPPSLKFILATTEVRKIPITILSRCQRFDLLRVSNEEIFNHLKKISKIENGKISEDALKLICNASEGSVRDALSLLDRALISQTVSKDSEINATQIRDMLGIADKTVVLSILKECFEGNENKSLDILKKLITRGLQAKNFLNDILEILHLISKKINFENIDEDQNLSENERLMINEISKNLKMEDISLFWQLTLKTIQDLSIISNESLALEMYIMQLIYVKNIDNFSDDNDIEARPINKKKKIESSLSLNNENKVKEQLKNTGQVIAEPFQKVEKEKPKAKVNNLQDVINLSNNDSEFELKFDLERNVSIVNFEKGKIEISFNDKLNKNFIKKFTEKLFDWTGERWIISLSQKRGKDTIHNKLKENKKLEISNQESSKEAKEILNAFPDAQLVEVVEDQNE